MSLMVVQISTASWRFGCTCQVTVQPQPTAALALPRPIAAPRCHPGMLRPPTDIDCGLRGTRGEKGCQDDQH